jgi:hypothetical protein
MRDIQYRFRDMFGGMDRVEHREEVRCHLEYCDRLASYTTTPRIAYATADSGADTNVLGREWLVVSNDPVRKVNVIGFDAEHARKKGLSVVTADTIAKTVDGREIILRSHQSVSNPSTTTTLLSEVQLRHAGHVVDSVHKDHLISIDGQRGTQSLYLKELDNEEGEVVYVIPFLQRAGLMTFEHRKPDAMDYQRGLPIVLLTLETLWDPQQYYDDHGKDVT